MRFRTYPPEEGKGRRDESALGFALCVWTCKAWFLLCVPVIATLVDFVYICMVRRADGAR